MSDTETARRQKNVGKEIPKKLLVFGGDCHAVNEFLEAKSDKPVFLLLQYINSLLRSFGFVIFANNPVSGFIIVLAIGSADYKAMFAAIFTSTLSFAFAKILQQDVLGNLNGFFSYNAVVQAVVSVSYLPKVYSAISLDEPRFWLILTFATLISVYFTSAFANLFRYLWHYPIPCFTVPFNVIQYILIFCLLHNTIPPRILTSDLLDPPFKLNRTDLTELVNNDSLANLTDDGLHNQMDFLQREKRKTNGGDDLDVQFNQTDRKWSWSDDVDNATDHLNWGETFSGTIVSLSQVYGLNNVPCAVLMYLAVVIYSPTTALFSYFGSILGTLTGVFLTSDFQTVYDGMWGCNGLLCCGALAGFGFVLTVQSAFLSLIAVLFCTVFQHFITPLFETMQVPIFHIPFLVTTVIFLLVTTEYDRALPRPGIYTYPEKHRREFKNQYRDHMEGYLGRARVSESGSP